ncbi:MAG: cupin domain-containing protein [Candidatus Muirbacterium halophilum]|nr:cupin domain-containing protein [Candidatus Muirbacterium halophilum]MCK9476188.1 cupin domain-containing protein [Candidatus Muirbacterium halophilum]
MIEKVFKMTIGNKKTIEKVIMDENIHYMHMILNNGEFLPDHFTNSTVYMTVVRGILSIDLEDNGFNKYEAGTILKIPFNKKMRVHNQDEQTLELIVVKAPAPVADVKKA